MAENTGNIQLGLKNRASQRTLNTWKATKTVPEALL